MIRLVISAFAALTLSCTTLPSEPLIIVEQSADSDHWHVTWVLQKPMTELRFERAAGGLRKEVFEVVTPGWFIARDGETEMLRTAGAPSREVEVRIRRFHRQLLKEYDFFEVFSDGSVALYTGHFLLENDSVRSYRFHPAPGRSIVLEGQRYDGVAHWTDRERQGTFVYFGTIQPMATADMISIVDPGMPEWLETKTRDMLPRLFSLYTDRLGTALPARPTVFFSFVDSDSSGYSSGGGTLPDLIQLGVEGKAWRTESQEGMLHQFHFLAHEAVHLWTAQLIHYQGKQDAWMHEGSADALAERALLGLGLIDNERFLAYQTRALNDCLRGANFIYACGNVIALLTDLAVDGDAFAFWRAMIAHTRRGEDSYYDTDDYFEVLRASGASEMDIRLIRKIGARQASAEDIAGALRSKGVSLVEETPPQWYGQSLAREGLVHLLSGHCQGNVGFRTTQRGFVPDSGVHCLGLTAESPIRKIDGIDVLREGEKVWDRLHERCGTETPVEVESTPVVCKEPVAARPRYLRVAGIS